MAFNFGAVEAAKENNFLKPGVYSMKVSEVKLDKFPKGKTYLGITLSTEDGLTLTDKLGFDWADESAKQNQVFISRMQYLHEAWVGKKCEKTFKKPEEIEEYYRKTFVNPKAGVRNIIVGGEVSQDGKTYAALPFTKFIVEKGDKIELGEFEEGDDNWKKYVKKTSRTSEASGKKGGILNEASEPDAKSEDTGGDDTPW